MLSWSSYGFLFGIRRGVRYLGIFYFLYTVLDALWTEGTRLHCEAHVDIQVRIRRGEVCYRGLDALLYIGSVTQPHRRGQKVQFKSLRTSVLLWITSRSPNPTSLLSLPLLSFLLSFQQSFPCALGYIILPCLTTASNYGLCSIQPRVPQKALRFVFPLPPEPRHSMPPNPLTNAVHSPSQVFSAPLVVSASDSSFSSPCTHISPSRPWARRRAARARSTRMPLSGSRACP